ncbi:hypothetical protein [Streptomyces sp. NPDC057838]|uniref:hypothetical protein n=1 Tax=unclassified Streptomyces TaxID=2593676 RepID=UPI00369EC30E
MNHIDDPERAAAELGVDLPKGFMYLGGGEAMVVGTAETFRTAAAILNRLEGRPVAECWPTESPRDTRSLSQMLADWQQRHGSLPPIWMSIKVIVEVLDHWQDLGLTAGERSDLIVIAENVNDATRETVGPLHGEHILARAGKTAHAWRTAINKLMRKKVLEYAVRDGREMRGRPGQYAVYRIPDLCPHPPHDGWKGMCTRPERVTPQMTHSSGMGHPSDDPLAGMGHLTEANGSPDRGEWVTPQMTPTPLTPQTPLSLPQRFVRAAAVVAEGEEREFIDWIKAKHQPRGDGWWIAASKNNSFTSLAADWRAQRGPAETDRPPLGCAECDDGYYDTGNGWAPCPHCNRTAA